MAFPAENLSTWEEIDRSESYLVSGMFEEASLLASSIIKDLIENHQTESVEDSDENRFDDMLESAAMVLVQSMKELGRTLHILKELELLFGSVTAVPVLVFITGTCLQISEGASSGADRYLEEFLGKWIYKDEGYYLLDETGMVNGKRVSKQLSLAVDKYLEIVDLYLITCLGAVTKKTDIAISWVEKAALPEEKRQELLRRLNSMSALNVSSSRASVPSSHVDDLGVESALKTSKNLESEYQVNKRNSVNETVLKLSRQQVPRFWWFRNITLKFGSHRLVISNGKVFMSCVVLLLCYYLRRKQASLQRVLKKQALSVKKAVLDLWQLAFSYQVNPLAAVQPLPAAPRGSR
ncbi:OLC1v1035789C1 [Oldenlandia corymbosa var. corymbosa]|uniref:OLC1v1035789C1 n=1 Tax=Oldenlandia corymbosa var. corymbosa TaxID=529605 RepID=A0AAV1CUH5_OLDCO|nr:OLC1v1035789C1 [Oldenlandia corymbosa var. corymbosa]